jgi:hypothetical protein
MICNCSIQNFLIYEENLIFFFISVLMEQEYVKKTAPFLLSLVSVPLLFRLGQNITGDFRRFLKYFIQHCFIRRTLDSTMSEDACIESRTVGTLTLMQSDALTTKLDLIHDLARAHTII